MNSICTVKASNAATAESKPRGANNKGQGKEQEQPLQQHPSSSTGSTRDANDHCAGLGFAVLLNAARGAEIDVAMDPLSVRVHNVHNRVFVGFSNHAPCASLPQNTSHRATNPGCLAKIDPNQKDDKTPLVLPVEAEAGSISCHGASSDGSSLPGEYSKENNNDHSIQIRQLDRQGDTVTSATTTITNDSIKSQLEGILIGITSNAGACAGQWKTLERVIQSTLKQWDKGKDSDSEPVGQVDIDSATTTATLSTVSGIGTARAPDNMSQKLGWNMPASSEIPLDCKSNVNVSAKTSNPVVHMDSSIASPTTEHQVILPESQQSAAQQHQQQHHQEQQQQEQQQEQHQPRPSDILLGRGPKCYSHVGNQRFRKLIHSHRHMYHNDAPRREKTMLVRRIIALIHQGGGRFLCERKVSHGNNDSGDDNNGNDDFNDDGNDGERSWHEVPIQIARKKVGHALRDARLAERLDARAGSVTPPPTTATSK